MPSLNKLTKGKWLEKKCPKRGKPYLKREETYGKKRNTGRNKSRHDCVGGTGRAGKTKQ